MRGRAGSSGGYTFSGRINDSYIAANRLLAAGAILRHPPTPESEPGGAIEGARTTAALAASRFGPVLKVSADGMITFFDAGRVWDI